MVDALIAGPMYRKSVYARGVVQHLRTALPLCSTRGGRTIRVEIRAAIGTEVDAVREPRGTCRGAESGQASWASAEFQVSQSSAHDEDPDNSAYPAYKERAESEQGYPHRRDNNADNDYLQRAAHAVLEVVADRLAHGL
jgi:hypothetical protein